LIIRNIELKKYNLIDKDMISNRILMDNKQDIVYFRNTYEGAVLRSVRGDGIYVKFRGEKEFRARDGSGVVEMAVMEKDIDYIDKETYNNW
jgi:hypothetical protein